MAAIDKGSKKLYGLLVVSILWGLVCRWAMLDRLPPWTDEMATMVFSLGKNFHSVPLNQVIHSEQLLQPLMVDSQTNFSDVWQNLMADSTHPPLYFWICHLWIKLFAQPDTILSIWLARSLSALFGLGAIACISFLGWFISRSRKVMMWTATIATLSPFGIFLAREARHYTLSLIWVSLALFCLVNALERLRRSQPIPLWLIIVWTHTNIFGMATHYFFALSIMTQGLVTLITLIKEKVVWHRWLPFWYVAAVSLMAGLIWIPAISSAHGTSPTQWLLDSSLWREPWLPILWLSMWMMSMLTMLPTAITLNISLWLTIISSLVILSYFAFILPKFWYSLKLEISPVLQTLIEYLLIILSLFLVMSYGFGVKITVAPRFCYLWFPAFMAIIGITIARLTQPTAIALTLTMAMFGSLTSFFALGYLQNERVDLLAQRIVSLSENQSQPLIVIPHKHHGQTGRLMGLAGEIQAHSNPPLQPDFFLAERDLSDPDNLENYDQAVQILGKVMGDRPQPTELFLINPRAALKHYPWENKGCSLQEKDRIGEFSYRFLICDQ